MFDKGLNCITDVKGSIEPIEEKTKVPNWRAARPTNITFAEMRDMGDPAYHLMDENR
jgi:hypothetical protein